jgi:carboxymethylenebutenolidase
VQGDDAARLIIAVDQHDGADAAMALAGAVLSACWAQELNISDEATLAGLLERCGLPAQRIEDGHSQAAQLRYEADTQRAVDAGVFGAPSYVVDGELFWGQDRLDFLERRLRA